MSKITNPHKMRDQVRELKAQGKTYAQISTELGITTQIAHYYGRPAPGENCCPRCGQKLKRK